MFTAKSYLKFLKILLPIFVVTLPLANRDIFSVVFNRIFPTRLALILMIFSGFLCLGAGFFRRKLFLKDIFIYLKKDFLFKVLTLLLILRLVSIKSSLNLSASLNLTLFYLSIIGLYLILKFVYESEREYLAKLLTFYLITVSVVALYGLLQLGLSFFGWRLPGVLVGSTFVRIPATFYDANHLPAYLITAFPAIFIMLFYVKKDYQKLSISLLLFVFALVLLFTFSRSGFLSFLVAFLILSFVFLKRRYWRKVLTVTVVFLFSLVVIFLTSQTQLSIFKRLSSVLNIEDKSTVAHGLLAYGSLELLKKSPIIGLGYGSFSEHFRRSAVGREHAFFDTATQVRIPAHSIWLEVLVETGILGFVVYLWLILTIVEKAYLSLKKIKIKRIYLTHLALFSSLIGILVSGLFYSYNLEFFWFFLFLVFFLSRNSLENQESVAADLVPPLSGDFEQVNWQPLFFVTIAVIVLSLLFFYKLDTVPILPGGEGLAAKVGWDMRRDWGYGVKNWWLPRFNSQVVANPPLPFWLNAFWTFLFDLGPWVPRFFPAFFALLGATLLFAYSLRVKGLAFAVLSVFLILSFPPFLNNIRYGGIYGYLFFVSAVLQHLLRNLSLTRKFLIVPLVLLMSFVSLISYEAYLVFLVFTVFYFWRRWKLSKSSEFLGLSALLSISLVPVMVWLHLLNRSNPGLLTSLVSAFSFYAFFLILIFLSLPWFFFWLAGVLLPKFSWRWHALLIPLIISSFYFSLRLPAGFDYDYLVMARTALNRDGRVPLYISFRPSSDLGYYSQVPLIFSSKEDLKANFRTEDYFYAIFDGESLRQLREENYGNFNSVKVSGQYVLIERPGKIK